MPTAAVTEKITFWSRHGDRVKSFIVAVFIPATIGLVTSYYSSSYLTLAALVILGALWGALLIPVADEMPDEFIVYYVFGGGSYLLLGCILRIIYNWQWFWSNPTQNLWSIFFQ